MTADCSACAPAAVPARRRARRAPWLALVLGLLAALVPKCPICLVAYLSVIGVTVGAAPGGLALVRPLGVALMMLALGFIILRRALRPKLQ
jgi:hypothetical protein